MPHEWVLVLMIGVLGACALYAYKRNTLRVRELQYRYILELLSAQPSMAAFDIVVASAGKVDPFCLHARLGKLCAEGLVTMREGPAGTGTVQLSHYAITEKGFEELESILSGSRLQSLRELKKKST